MLLVWHGSILPKILPRLLAIFAFAILIYCLRDIISAHNLNLSPAVFTLMGIALAIFLGFCNTASYDRYWEGRKLWGALLIETRSLTREIMAWMPNIPLEEKQQCIKMLAAFSWSLNDQLRKKKNSAQWEQLLHPLERKLIATRQFKPIAILDLVAAWLADKHRTGAIDSIQLTAMDNRLDQLSAIVGGCERINNTPLPFAYHLLLHRTVYIYCFLLPFGLVDAVHRMMPLVVLFISYTFIGLDAIVDEIGEPFGQQANDLPLNNICRTIQASVFEQASIPHPPLESPKSHFID